MSKRIVMTDFHTAPTNSRGHWVDTETGEITPAPEASYGRVASPVPSEIEMVAKEQSDGTFKIEPMRIRVIPCTVPAGDEGRGRGGAAVSVQTDTTQAAIRLAEALAKKQREKEEDDRNIRTRMEYGITVSFAPDPTVVEIREALAAYLGIEADDVRVTVY